jgi:hypothetical protein
MNFNSGEGAEVVKMFLRSIIWRVLPAALSLFLSGCGDASVAGLAVEVVEEDAPSPVMLFTIFQDATGVTMTNAAAAGTEITSLASRTYIDLSSFSQIRAQFTSSLTSSLVGCRVEYSLDDGTSWSVLVPNFAASTVASANTLSTWGDIPEWAKTTVLLRGMIVGNGVLDPIVRYIRVSVK